MSALARAAVVALACLAAGGGARVARAQDALGPGADFSDDWDAILNLAPPPSSAGSTVATTAANRRSQPTRTTEREGRSAARDRSASSRDVAADTERRERRASEGEGEAPGMANEAEDRGRRKPKVELLDVPGYAPGGYEGLAASWHRPWPDNDAQQLAARSHSAPALSLHPVGRLQTPYVLIPAGEDGGFDDGQVEVASKALSSWQGGPRVSARLLDLIYHAAKHFDVYHVHVVSGVRRDRSGSRHSHGLAADIVFPGVDDNELAAYFRPQGFCGVGIYTRAGFVHIDVRERSYFWLDKSPPGRRLRIIPVRGDEAKAADEAALVRGQTGYVNPPRLQKALHARMKHRMAQAQTAQ